MKDNFDKCFDMLLMHENGFVNHPEDPGNQSSIEDVAAIVWRSFSPLGTDRILKHVSFRLKPNYRDNPLRNVMGMEHIAALALLHYGI